MAGVTVGEVSDATFEVDVVEASFERPVVVDFWAPWCGPCRSLGPLLERLAESAKGAWTLAKVNVDQNPSLATRFGIQGIPAVKGFRDGRAVAEFVGAQPEVRVRRFLDQLVPSEADTAAAQGRHLAASGDLHAAEVAFRAALAMTPNHSAATLGLGTVLAEAGRTDEALDVLGTLSPGSPEGREAAPLIARLRLAAGSDGLLTDGEAVRALESDPRDPAANLSLGRSLASRGEYAEALAHLLTVVQRDKVFQDGAARTAMVAIFDVLGSDDPLTVDYRRRLSSALYA